MTNDFDNLVRQVRDEASAEGPEAVAELDTLHERYRLAREVFTRRSALGLTQQQLAERSGLHQSVISRVEQGRLNPTFDTLSALAKAMGVHVCLTDVCESDGGSKQRTPVLPAQ